MRKCIFFLLVSILIFYSFHSIAKEDKKEEIPAGMEIIQVGDGQRLYVPKGTKTRKVGAQLILEDNSEYVAKRFSEIEDYIKTLQANIEELKNEIGQLRKAISDMQKSKLLSQENEKP